MKNVGGELMATIETIKKAILLNINNLDIFYDYDGIANWANGDQNAEKDGTISYYNFIKENNKIITLNFIKVKSHSNDAGNDEADLLAKQACFLDYYENNNI